MTCVIGRIWQHNTRHGAAGTVNCEQQQSLPFRNLCLSGRHLAASTMTGMHISTEARPSNPGCQERQCLPAAAARYIPQLSPCKTVEAAIVGVRHCQRHKPGCSQAVPHMCVERLVTPQPYRTCQQGFDTCQLLATEGDLNAGRIRLSLATTTVMQKDSRL